MSGALAYRLSSATKALGKMQHEHWTDAGEALGRDDLKGVHMPSGKAKDLSSTFPRPSVKCEEIWNEVSGFPYLNLSSYSLPLVVHRLRCQPDSNSISAASVALRMKGTKNLR